MLSTSPLSRFEVHVGLVQSLGAMDGSERRVVPITGGTASGKLTGAIASVGEDWQWVRSDGSTQLSAHYMLRTPENELIEIRSNGYRHGPPEVMQRLAKGEVVDPELYYFRTSIAFSTSSKAWARLNHVVAIGVGERKVASVVLRVFEVL